MDASGLSLVQDVPVHDILPLLAETRLPVADLEEDVPRQFLALSADGKIAGTIGLEFLSPDHALLRSLAVLAGFRGTGQGRRLVAAAEALAREKQIKSIFLLTETAGLFFRKIGYRPFPRDHVPETVRNCRQFSGLCPDSAALLSRDL